MNRKMLSTLIMAATMAIGGLGAANINSNKTSQRNEVLLSSASASSTATSNSEGSTSSASASSTATSNSEGSTSSASASSIAASNSEVSASNSSAKATATSNSEVSTTNSSAKATATSNSEASTTNSSAKATATSNSEASTTNSSAKATATSNSEASTTNSSAKATATSNSEASTTNSSAKATATSNSETSTSNSSAQTEHKGNQGTSSQGGQTEHKGNQGTSNQGGQTEHKGNQGTSNQGGQTENKGNQGTSNQGGQTEHKGNQGTSSQGGQTEHKGNQGTSNQGGQTENKGNQGTSNQGGQTENKGNQGTSNQGGQTEHKGNQSNSQTTQQQPLTTYDGLVSTNNKTINVMSAPTTVPSYSFVVGTLGNGKNVKIISKDNGYYEIEFGGSIGYVNINDINTTAATIPTSTSVANKENSIKENVNYPTSMKKYVAQQLQSYKEATGNSMTKEQLENTAKQISTAVNPKAAATVFEFLKVNEYRNVNAQELNQALQGKGVLEGQGQAFINAAKEYNLDPVYLLAQCALETGWGHSNFAQGTTIKEVANLNDPIKNSKGQLVGYKMIKLKKPVTVYNLFGVGAYDNTKEFSNKATITAEAYAYEHGWTSVSSALQGAAEFLANNYVHNSKYNQNTPYALRYVNGGDSEIWHQYSTDINYGQSIGEIMKQYSYLYNANDRFSFGIPTFQNK